jgi:hypothetical protein
LGTSYTSTSTSSRHYGYTTSMVCGRRNVLLLWLAAGLLFLSKQVGMNVLTSCTATKATEEPTAVHGGCPSLALLFCFRLRPFFFFFCPVCPLLLVYAGRLRVMKSFLLPSKKQLRVPHAQVGGGGSLSGGFLYSAFGVSIPLSATSVALHFLKRDEKRVRSCLIFLTCRKPSLNCVVCLRHTYTVDGSTQSGQKGWLCMGFSGQWCSLAGARALPSANLKHLCSRECASLDDDRWRPTRTFARGDRHKLLHQASRHVLSGRRNVGGRGRRDRCLFLCFFCFEAIGTK